MGLLATYWDLTWDLPKSCAPCTKKLIKGRKLRHFPSYLGLRTLAGWRLSGFHGLTTHVFLMRSL